MLEYRGYLGGRERVWGEEGELEGRRGSREAEESVRRRTLQSGGGLGLKGLEEERKVGRRGFWEGKDLYYYGCKLGLESWL